MDEKYIDLAKVFKVLADPKRLRIIKLLHNQEMCGCDLLEEFHITQPTLSHDMKLLQDSKLVKARKDGKWSYYYLNKEFIDSLYKEIGDIFSK